MKRQGLVPVPLHFAAIGLLSLSMIAIQILITRIFSVVFYYHFAFAGVTFAMLGLTVGALRVYGAPAKYTAANVNAQCAKHTLIAAVLLVASTLMIVDIPGRLLALAKHSTGSVHNLAGGLGVLSLLLGPILLIAVFIFIGICVTLLLTYFPSYTNRLYATDLICAALGCVLVVLVLKFLDPVSIMMLLASALSLLSWRLLKTEPARPKPKRLTFAVVLVLCSLFAAQSSSYVAGAPLFHLRIGKLAILEPFIFERWNSFTHVGIYPNPDTKPFGWGFGSALNNADYKDVKQYWLKIDADAGTVLTRFDGDFKKVGYLKYDIINFGYQLRDIHQAAIIGIGGGRDVLSALTFGVKQITGIEINPAIFEALNRNFADFTHHLSTYPGVDLVNAEARSYISSHPATYDIVQISLIDTWAATVAGGLTLSENKLYTKEAWVEFLNHLNPNGMLVVSRWFAPGKHQGELYRLLSLANDSVKAIDPGADTRKHVLILNANNIITIVVSKSSFTPAEILKATRLCKTYGFAEFVGPGHRFDDISDTIVSGNATPAFYRSLPLDVTTPTDDRPFFFNMSRLSRVLFEPMEGARNHANNVAVYVLVILAAVVFFYMACAVLWPLGMLYWKRRDELQGVWPFALYFSFIGLGFMFIEMSLMQWLMIFLGHPVYALSVILFTLLLFSGIGSYTVDYNRLTRRTYILRSAVLCLLLAATLYLSIHLHDSLAHNSTAMRIFYSVLLLIPASLFLGMMFPLGVAAAKRKHAELLPWFWGLNGAASVFASIFAMVISMSYGASITYMAGLACYAVCFLLCLRIGKQ